MSGHSKWAQIKRQKGVADAKRGQLFTKLGRELTVAAREGADPNGNARLRMALQRAREANMPHDTIDRAIKRGAGAGDGANYQEITYEGYGPGGTAVMVQALTDNRNRTAAEVRSTFSRNGGNLGETGSVGWLFASKGVIAVEVNGLDPDDVALQAIDSGAEDVQVSDDIIEIYTDASELEAVRSQLEKDGVAIADASGNMIPQTDCRPRPKGGRAGSETHRQAGRTGRRAERVHEHRDFRRGSRQVSGVTAPAETPPVPSSVSSRPVRAAMRRGVRDFNFSSGARWFFILVAVAISIWFISRIGSIIWPFLWALLVAYILMPIVNFMNLRLRVPRFLVILGLFLIVISALITGSRYLVPWLQQQLTFFAQDLPKINGSLMNRVGPNPLGIDITRVEEQLSDRLRGATSNSKNATKLLTTAFSTAVRVLLFLFTTFYLLMDGPRIKRNLQRIIPGEYRPEILVLSNRINSTWMSYIRGELILFGIMTTASFIGLRILGVPGAIALALGTGLLELVPIVGPVTAGALAVSVAYLNGGNPFGWSQITYGIVVALMYLALRETEDYVVIPRVLGQAVKLHPLVILFALTAGGIVAGLFGLLVAVPIAASLKIIGAYLYDKLIATTPEFVNVHGVGDPSGP